LTQDTGSTADGTTNGTGTDTGPTTTGTTDVPTTDPTTGSSTDDPTEDSTDEPTDPTEQGTEDPTEDPTGGELECESIEVGGPFESTMGNPGFAFELPLEPDTPYRRLTVTLDLTPNDWGGQCYNPYYDPPKLVPVFHNFLVVQRGQHWCKGGNLGGIQLRGPGSNRMIGNVYYKEMPWGGSGCGPAVEPHSIFGGEKNLMIPQGETRAVTYVHDADAGVIDLAIGDAMFSGTPHPESQLLALPGYPLYLTLSRNEWLECYNAQGEEEPGAVCCHGPSIGWVYDAVNVEICR